MGRLPLVAIVGRPNVGKSTLFNRLLGRRQAIVADTPGVTRDRVYGTAEWAGRTFLLVDTGGLEPDLAPRGEGRPEAAIAGAARAQALAAVREADLVVFVVDGRLGLHPDDREIAEILRRSKKPILLAANKLDGRERLGEAGEFYALGLGDPLGISAEHGVNVGDLADAIVRRLPAEAPGEGAAPAGEAPPVRVCVVGRPNVGKSSLVNRLLGEERVIVSDVPGTTREAVDSRWEVDGRVFELVDTAGLRRRARVDSAVEYYGVLRTLRAVERCDVALLVLDAARGIAEQDQRIAGHIEERGRACVILVNKWDAVAGAGGGEEAAERFTRDIRIDLSFISYAPVLFVSARTGLGLSRLPGLIARVAANHAARVPTPDLNRVLKEAQGIHPPPAVRGRALRIVSGAQTDVRPPTFLLFCNDPDLVHNSYERYLENRLRDAFDLAGTPIRFRYQRRERPGRAVRGGAGAPRAVPGGRPRGRPRVQPRGGAGRGRGGAPGGRAGAPGKRGR